MCSIVCTHICIYIHIYLCVYICVYTYVYIERTKRRPRAALEGARGHCAAPGDLGSTPGGPALLCQHGAPGGGGGGGVSLAGAIGRVEREV